MKKAIVRKTQRKFFFLKPFSIFLALKVELMLFARLDFRSDFQNARKYMGVTLSRGTDLTHLNLN